MTASSHQSAPAEHFHADASHKIDKNKNSYQALKMSRTTDVSNSQSSRIKSAHVNINGLIVAFVYGLCSASMAFANKAILSSYNFTFQFFLILVQMVISVVVLEILRGLRLISLPAYSLQRGWSFFVPSMLYALHSVLALSALSGMNIPMYGVVKRCAPIVILLLGTVVLKKGPPTKMVCVAIAMITAGCFIAGYGDLAFDPKAYMYGGVSVVTQSLYLLLVQRNAQTLSATETLHLNSYNTLLPLFCCSLATGEFGQALREFAYRDTGFVMIFTLVVCMGCALNYLLFLCTTLNSALTTSVTGTLKSIIQTAIGMFTFGGISVNLFTIIGILMNLSGGVVYSFEKLRQTQQKLKGAESWESEKLVTLESENSSNNNGERIV